MTQDFVIEAIKQALAERIKGTTQNLITAFISARHDDARSIALVEFSTGVQTSLVACDCAIAKVKERLG